MIWNIVDSRTRRYRWREVDAVIEAVTHDNKVKDADHAEDDGHYGLYEDKKGVLLHDAIEWAESHPAKVTLFLYDKGSMDE